VARSVRGHGRARGPTQLPKAYAALRIPLTVHGLAYRETAQWHDLAIAFGAMEGDEGLRHLSWRDLAAREEATLAFPGSRLIDEEQEQHDEGEGWGFDNVQKAAMLHRGYVVDADGDEVQDWFRTELEALGWTFNDGYKRTPDMLGFDSYSLGSARFSVRVFGHQPDRPWWSYWPSALDGATGLFYDITFSDGETLAGS
jgi:hypothetical protein